MSLDTHRCQTERSQEENNTHYHMLDLALIGPKWLWHGVLTDRSIYQADSQGKKGYGSSQSMGKYILTM